MVTQYTLTKRGALVFARPLTAVPREEGSAAYHVVQDFKDAFYAVMHAIAPPEEANDGIARARRLGSKTLGSDCRVFQSILQNQTYLQFNSATNWVSC